MADFLGVDMQWHPEGYYYGLDEKYHAPNQRYFSGINVKGEPVKYRPDNELYGIEDGIWHNAGSRFGVDGDRHEANWFYGVDGEYHHPDTHYDIMTGKYTEPPPPKK